MDRRLQNVLQHMITFQFIIETDSVGRLLVQIEASPLTLFSESSTELKLRLEDWETKRPTIELNGSLVVYIVNDGPDVEVDVPAVPG